MNEHVRILDDFFRRTSQIPPVPTPLDAVLSHEADALLEGHAQRDAGAAMMIHLNTTLPAARPTADEIFATAFDREDALEIVARTYLFDSWSDVLAAKERVVDPRFESAVEAIVSGDVAALQRLLGESPALISSRSAFGHESTLLHYVAANGVEIRRQRTPNSIVDLTKTLLEAGAEVDALSQSYGGGPNQTALCLTVSSGHPYEAGLQPDIVATLLDGGANINGLASDGTPIATALAFGYLETAQLLARRGARIDNIVLASGLGQSDAVSALIDVKGQLVGIQRYVDPFGQTIESAEELKDRALILACKHGHRDVASLLLDAGGNVDFAPIRNETSLHWAAYHGHLAVVELLVERGANVSLKDEQWHAKPVDWAVEGGHATVVEYLSTRDAGG